MGSSLEAQVSDTRRAGNHNQEGTTGMPGGHKATGTLSACHILYNDGVFVINKTSIFTHIFVYLLSIHYFKNNPKTLTKK